MRFIASLDQHPEVRRQRFSAHLWPHGEHPKDVDEGWIVLEFMNAIGVQPDAAPTKLQPPSPDIACVIDGDRILFELGEILDTDLGAGVVHSGQQAHKKSEAIARGDHATANTIRTAGFRSFPANASLERMLRQKLAKAYETSGHTSHLLLFYDQQTPWGPFDYLLQWQDELAHLIGASVFQRVWIFHLPAATPIGYLEAAADGTLRAHFDWRFHFDFRAPFDALVPGGGEKPDEICRFVPVLTGAGQSR
jgi:hypothetical protein